jgi:hypothetical protein
MAQAYRKTKVNPQELDHIVGLYFLHCDVRGEGIPENQRTAFALNSLVQDSFQSLICDSHTCGLRLRSTASLRLWVINEPKGTNKRQSVDK